MGSIIREYLEKLEEIVNIDSGSYNPQGIYEVAARIAKWFEDIGWYVIRHNISSETGPVLEIYNRDPSDYDVTFVGHMDTVFPEGESKRRPFKVVGDKAMGPGASDMKNGLTAMYLIAAKLPQAVQDKLSICMLFTPDEEIGSIYTKDLQDVIARKSRCIFVMESASENQTHCFARKGASRFALDFYGKAAHSGFMFERENASAIYEMANYILKLMNLASREKDTTVNVGMVEGGTALNVVPDYASLKVEIRYKFASEKQRIEEAVEELLKSGGIIDGVKVEQVNKESTPPWERGESTEKFIDYLRAIANSKGIDFNERDRGGLSDANHLAQHCEFVADGMGPRGDLDHSKDEYTSVSDIDVCLDFFLALLEDLANKKEKKEE